MESRGVDEIQIPESRVRIEERRVGQWRFLRSRNLLGVSCYVCGPFFTD